MAVEEKQPVYDIEPAVASGDSSTKDSALDDSYDVYKRNQGIEYDEAEAKRVLRKIDYRIVPVLFVTYMLQYLDKVSIALVPAEKTTSSPICVERYQLC